MNNSMNDFNKLSASVQQNVLKYSQIKEILTRMVVPMTFQKGAILVGLVLCIICLVLLASAFYSLNETRNHPPNKSDCPDYYKREGDNCKYDSKTNAYPGLASKDPKCQSFNPDELVPDKVKYIASTTCGIQWDGITNNNDLKK